MSGLAGLFFGALSVAAAFLWWLPQRRGRDRGYLDTYQSQAKPMFLRNYTTVAPLFVVMGICFTLIAIAPPWAGIWLAAVALLMVPAAMHLSHRVPAPGMPDWLREDIQAGVVEPARPDRSDDVAYWLLSLLGTVGGVSCVGIGLAGILGSRGG